MNSDSPNGRFAWYLRMLTLVGMTGVTAFLLAQSAGWIPSETRAIGQTLLAHDRALVEHMKMAVETAVAVKVAARIMCENGARDPEQRRNCENIR